MEPNTTQLNFDDLGAEPLDGSGFEEETPEPFEAEEETGAAPAPGRA